MDEEQENSTPLEAPVDLPGGDSPAAEPKQPHQKKSKKLVFIIAGSAIGVLLIGFIVWKLVGGKKTETPTDQPPSTQTSTNSTGLKPSDISSAGLTKDFTAETLAVGFSYPNDWTVTEKEGTITVKSPDFNYDTTDIGTIKGYFRIYIRKAAREIDSKYIGRGVVVKDTEKLTYTKPNPTQRTETNLSFFGYDGTNNFAFMMITGNFNLKKGDSLGPNYGKEADTYIIVGGHSADDNKDDLEFHQVPPDSFQSSNAYKQAVEILKSLKVS